MSAPRLDYRNLLFVGIILLLSVLFLWYKLYCFDKTSGRKPKYWRLYLPSSYIEQQLRSQLQQQFQKKSGDRSFRLRFSPHSSEYSVAVITSFLEPSSIYECHIDSLFDGITPLYVPKAASFDIVIVPGLGGHPLGSFRSKDGWAAWPLDFLHNNLPQSRILAYGYDSVARGNDDKSSLTDLAQRFLESLRNFRVESETHTRPIIFIGHSLGGLLIKEALALAHEFKEKNDQCRDLFRSAFGLMLFGVPNLGLRHFQLLTMVGGQANEHLIRDLQTDRDREESAYLRALTRRFMRMCETEQDHLQIVSYYETRRSHTLEEQTDGTWANTGQLVLMVTRESATKIDWKNNEHQSLSMNTDHRGLVRVDHKMDDKYQSIVARLKAMASNEALETVRRRHLDEEALTAEQDRAWRSFNRPPYDAFRNSEKLSKAAPGTLQWLTDNKVAFEPRMPAINGEISSIPQVPTTDELFQRLDFERWRDASYSQSLLITAPPGSGKSVLSEHIIGHLENWSTTTSQSSKVIYYFCNIKNDEKDRHACAIIRGLIVQLCEREKTLFAKIPIDWINDSDKFHAASVDDLWSLLSKLASDIKQKTLYCVIDGLDVYEHGMDELLTKLKGFAKLVDREKGPVIKLLCTSRPSQCLLSQWQASQHRRLFCNGPDIDTFVSTRISQLSDLDEVLKTFAVKRLTEKTEHTFLWLDVVIRSLNSLVVPSQMDIDEVIESSNSTLYGLYGDLIKATAASHPKLARLLVWVVYAKRPLTLLELGSAITIDPERIYESRESHTVYSPSPITAVTLRKHLGTLLDVSEGPNGGVYLIHQSLKDYFEQYNPLWAQFPLVTELRLVPAYVCLTYLASTKDKETAKIIDSKRTDRALELNYHSFANDYPFFNYAATYWHFHIERVTDIQSRVSMLGSILGTDSFNTWLWVNWPPPLNPDFLSIWFSDIRMFRGYVLYGANWPVQILLHYDIPWLGELLLSGNERLKAELPENVLEKAGHNLLIQLFRQPEGLNYKVTESTIIRIMREFNHKVVELMLAHCGDEIGLTERMLEAVAENPDGGAILNSLLDRQANGIHITNNLVRTIAEKGKSKSIMELLLDRRGNEVQITNDIVLDLAGNYNGEGILKLLLDRRPDDVHITNEVVLNVAGNYNGEGILKLLLDRRPDDVHITNEVVLNVAWNYNGEGFMKLLLDRRPDDVHITNEVVLKVAGNSNGEGFMKLLLDRRPDDVHITNEVVLNVAGNYNGEGFMKLLLDRRPDDVHITNEVVLKVAGNFHGGGLMRLLLDRGVNEIQITHELVKIVATRSTGKGFMELLLGRWANEVHITEDVVRAAAGNSHPGVIEVLLDQRPNEVHITEDVVKAAAGNNHPGVIEALLDQRPNEVHITEDVVRAAARVSSLYGSSRVMEVLLDRRPDEVHITEDVVKAAAGNRQPEIIEVLLDRRPNEVHITENVVKAAAESRAGENILEVLLERRPDEVHITKDVILKAAGNFNGVMIIKLLLEAGKTDVRVPDGKEWTPLHTAANKGRIGVVELLLERGFDVAVTNNEGWTPLHAASASGKIEVVRLLLGKGARFTAADRYKTTPLLAASRTGREEVVQLLLLETDNVVVAAPDITGWTPLRWAILKGHKRVVQLLANASVEELSEDAGGSATLLELATIYGHTEIETILIERGAQITDDPFGLQQLFKERS